MPSGHAVFYSIYCGAQPLEEAHVDHAPVSVPLINSVEEQGACQSLCLPPHTKEMRGERWKPMSLARVASWEVLQGIDDTYRGKTH